MTTIFLKKGVEVLEYLIRIRNGRTEVINQHYQYQTVPYLISWTTLLAGRTDLQTFMSDITTMANDEII